MILRREAIDQRLKELDLVLQELNKYQDIDNGDLRGNLSQQWIIERGLIAAATVIFDVADHILAGHFGFYSETYEESLEALQDNGVISRALHREVRGLGGLRNILIHRYTEIDTREVLESYHKALRVFPGLAREVLAWLDTLEE